VSDRRARVLISPEALAAEPACIVFDCRFSLTDKHAGRREYEAGHIPGARFVDLERDLSGPRGPGGEGGRHPLPDREVLCERLRSLGVDEDSSVVCYDRNSGAVAGRFWWLVRWLGHADVRLLEGGFDAWIAAGFETETAEPVPERGDFTTFDAVAGHIPGAICAPFAGNLEAGRFKSADELAERFRRLGADPTRDTVCYCGSGVTATHNLIALLLAGYPEPALYAGSWSDWISNPARPLARG